MSAIGVVIECFYIRRESEGSFDNVSTAVQCVPGSSVAQRVGFVDGAAVNVLIKTEGKWTYTYRDELWTERRYRDRTPASSVSSRASLCQRIRCHFCKGDSRVDYMCLKYDPSRYCYQCELNVIVISMSRFSYTFFSNRKIIFRPQIFSVADEAYR